MARLREEHLELHRLVASARTSRPDDARRELAAFADLLERHVRWEERDLFPYAEDHLDPLVLEGIGGEIEKRLVR
jgi:hemerythrin-like domain-containing protein